MPHADQDESLQCSIMTWGGDGICNVWVDLGWSRQCAVVTVRGPGVV